MPNFFNSSKDSNSYFKWRLKRADEFIQYISESINIKDKSILDIGCGQGSLCCSLSKYTKKVTGVDNCSTSLNLAKKMCKNVKFIKADAKKLPFKDNSFDIITLFYIMEHVDNPKLLLKECKRILKKKGHLCIEFPPYYALTGHHLYRFTLLPAQYLPKKMMKKIVLSKKSKSKIETFADSPTTPENAWKTFITLNKITISKFKRISKSFKTVNEKFIFKFPDVFNLNLKVLKYIPAMREVFTLSYFVVLRK